MKEYITIDRYGHKLYFKDEEKTILHRMDGPAVEWTGGHKEWHINGVFILSINRYGTIASRMRWYERVYKNNRKRFKILFQRQREVYPPP